MSENDDTGLMGGTHSEASLLVSAHSTTKVSSGNARPQETSTMRFSRVVVVCPVSRDIMISAPHLLRCAAAFCWGYFMVAPRAGPSGAIAEVLRVDYEKIARVGGRCNRLEIEA